MFMTLALFNLSLGIRANETAGIDSIYIEDCGCSGIIYSPDKDENEHFNIMTVRTNLAYDLLAVPNIGVGLGLCYRWSLGVNVMYGWWTNHDEFFWRTYATDINLRKYFGGRQHMHPLQGHHLGIYGGIATYDYELGGRGYMSDYKDEWSRYFGIEYGWSMPIAKQLNLDLSIGLGYFGGQYKEYLPVMNEYPEEMHYVWQVTRNINYWGPTRLEIALVWMIGQNNK